MTENEKKEGGAALRDFLLDWRRHAVALGAIAVMLAIFSLTGGGRDDGRANALAAGALFDQTVTLSGEDALIPEGFQGAWKSLHGALVAGGIEGVAEVDAALPVRFHYEGPKAIEENLREHLRRAGLRAVEAPQMALGDLGIEVHVEGSKMLSLSANFAPFEPPSMTGAMSAGDVKAQDRVTKADAHRIPGPWWSILPPLIAVIMALVYRRVLLALGSAVWGGALMVQGMNPVAATTSMVQDYLLVTFGDGFKLYVIGFTLALVGMVHVSARSGGNQGLVNLMGRFAKTARSTRVATACMGLIVFFDDYANALIVGSSARSLTDRMRISREKLAYIVDSTAAPVAGIALISTWVGYEIGLFESVAADIQLDMGGFEIFLMVLPTRFYCFFSLLFVFVGAWSARDYGPMLKAERRAMELGQLSRPGAVVAELPEHGSDQEPRWYNALIPIATIVFGVVVGIAWNGSGAIVEGGGPSPDLLSMEGWRLVFTSADNAMVLFYAALLGSVVSIGMVIAQRALSPVEALVAWLQGMRMMTLPMGILLLAWSMQLVTNDLGTSYYLVSVLEAILNPSTLPLAVFIAAAAVAFSTGTSWGTMGILLPALIPLAWTLSGGDMMLTALCMGAILDGAIFGDHCSPISDTTVMSSIASGCDHIDHVRTQLPYALTVMGISIFFGYFLLPMGLPIEASYALGALAIFGVFYIIASPIERPVVSTD